MILPLFIALLISSNVAWADCGWIRVIFIAYILPTVPFCIVNFVLACIYLRKKNQIGNRLVETDFLELAEEKVKSLEKQCAQLSSEDNSSEYLLLCQQLSSLKIDLEKVNKHEFGTLKLLFKEIANDKIRQINVLKLVLF